MHYINVHLKTPHAIISNASDELRQFLVHNYFHILDKTKTYINFTPIQRPVRVHSISQSYYTVLQKYAYIELKQNLLRSITRDIITRLLANATFVCVHPVGRFSKDFSEVRGLRSRGFQLQVKKWQQYCMRNYEKKCK